MSLAEILETAWAWPTANLPIAIGRCVAVLVLTFLALNALLKRRELDLSKLVTTNSASAAFREGELETQATKMVDINAPCISLVTIEIYISQPHDRYSTVRDELINRKNLVRKDMALVSSPHNFMTIYEYLDQELKHNPDYSFIITPITSNISEEFYHKHTELHAYQVLRYIFRR